MAQFDANINLRVVATEAEKKLKQFEKKLQSLEKRTLSRAKKNEGLASNLITGGKAAGQNVSVRLQRQQAKAAQDALRVADARVEKELRLAAAMQRQETILKALNRAGGAQSKAAQERVTDALAASKEAKNNLGIQNAVNTLLEKELQIRREINRVRFAGDEAKRVGRARGPQIDDLAARGGQADKIAEVRRLNAAYVLAAEKGETDIAKAIDRRFKRKFELLKRDVAATEAAAKSEERSYAKADRVIRRLRVKRLQEQKRAAKQFQEDLALGAGFPLLFGGGVGAVGGGVAGALAGQGKGGFGLQILFSALGTQIDTFVASMQDKAKELGKAFSDINGSFDVLKEKLIISSKAEEKRIQALADQGRTVDANVEALKDFQRQFGSDSVTNIKNLSSELDRADRAFAKLGASLLNLLNGPLLRFAKAGADLAELIDFPNTVNAASQGLDPRFRDAFKKDFRNILRELEKEQLRQRGFPTEEQRLELSKTALQQALDKYGPYRIEVTVELTEEQKLKQQIERLQEAIKIPQKTIELLNSVDSLKNLLGVGKEIENRNQQIIDRAEAARLAAERRTFDARLAFERRIEDLRLRSIAKENQLLDQQARNRLARFDIETLQQQGSNTGSKASSEAKAVVAAARDLQRTEIEVEEEKARIKRNAALEVQRFELQVARTVFDARLQAARANEDAARTELEINRTIEREKQQFSQKRFDLERKILEAQILIQGNELKILAIKAKLTEQERANINLLVSNAQAKVKELSKVDTAVFPNGVAPGDFGRVGTGDVSGFEAAAERYIQLIRDLETASIEGAELKINNATQRLKNAIKKLDESVDVNEILDSRNRSLRDERRATAFRRQGYRESDVQELIKANSEYEKQFKQLQDNKDLLQRVQNETKIGSVEYKLLGEAITNTDVDMKLLTESAQKFVSTFDQNGKLNDEMIQLANTVSTQVANAFQTAIVDTLTAAIQGAEDLNEKLKATAATLLTQIGGALFSAGVGSIGTNGPGSGSGLLGQIFNRDTGGPVTSRQPYIVGERGPELFIPRASGAVVNNADSRAALDRYTPTDSYSYSPNLNITTGPVMQMDNKDYISREDFERGMRKASDDGAKRGEAMTLKRLKNSRSTRAQLGM